MVEMMTRRLTLTVSTLRPQLNRSRSRIAAGLARDVWQAEEQENRRDCRQRICVGRGTTAHTRMESSAHTGKIVLEAGV